MGEPGEWHQKEEVFLRKLSEECEKLSVVYNEIYNIFKKREPRFKLPIIFLGSVLGMLSFGSSQFGADKSFFINIVVGSTTVVISIISSIEAYLQIGEIMSKSLLVSTQLKKLKDDIDVELAVLPEDRVLSGTLFVRKMHHEYVTILESAPSINSRRLLLSSRKFTNGLTKKIEHFDFTTSPEIHIDH